MKRTALALLAILLAACLLAACGGDGTPSSETSHSTSPVTASSSMSSQTSAAITNPEDITGITIDAGQISMLCPDGWNEIPSEFEYDNRINIYKGATDVAEPYECLNIAVEYFAKNGDQITIDSYRNAAEEQGRTVRELGPMELGGKTYSGFEFDVGQTDSSVFLFAYVGDSAYMVTVSLRQGGMLSDADVQAVLMSIRSNAEISPGGTTSYNVGNEFAVFAVDVPDGPAVEVGADFMRIEDAATGWHIDLWSMTPGPFTTATSATGYLEWYTREYGSTIEECTLGTVQGYMVKAAKDGTVFVLSYAFDGLTGEANTWGAIEISSTSGMSGDAEPFLDDPVVQGILNSVHAPE